MTINMICDHCEQLIDPEINGGARLRLGKKEYVFHLCDRCQELLRQQVGDVFLKDSTWREV